MKRAAFIVVSLAVLIGGSLAIASTASAHVLLTDTTGSVGAILHIMPDDDPVAGESSDIYFDRQGAASKAAEVKLTVTSSEGDVSEVRLDTTNSLSTGEYTFPAQGVYELAFTSKGESGTYVFQQSQRVSRGVMVSGAATQQHIWAEALMVGSVVGFFALLVIMFNRRKQIAQQSTF